MPRQARKRSSISELPVTLVTGVAKPEPLLAFLREKGIQVTHRRFRDHHIFTGQEVQEFNALPFVLTTEKDYMRLKGRVEQLYYLGIRHCFLGDGESVLVKILKDL